jgi:hypothetical protein
VPLLFDSTKCCNTYYRTHKARSIFFRVLHETVLVYALGRQSTLLLDFFANLRAPHTTSALAPRAVATASERTWKETAIALHLLWLGWPSWPA